MIDGTNLNQLTGSRQLLRAFGASTRRTAAARRSLGGAEFLRPGISGAADPALRKKVRDVEK